ncbi:MAG TPA: S8/S53 family peptidase [Saprospiraceae bacterium]|nr:S8/S53 family peptidase [Saprospiraceae bacterium]
MIETEELLTAEAPVAAAPGIEILAAPPTEIFAQTNYNDLLQHIPSEWKMTRGKNVKIAVLDSGFVLHQDLKNSIVETFNAVNLSSDVRPTGSDDVNHGNNVAGLVAASSGFADGVLGVAPDAKIIAIKISDNGHIDGNTVLRGLDFAINKTQCDIINMSFSIDEAEYLPFQNDFLNLFQNAKSKGILLVASAGDNSRLLAKRKNLLLPASEEDCLSVGTINESFIQNNPNPSYHPRLNYIIPNQSLKSCAGTENTYSMINNSSMAAGILSGAAALLVSHHNGVTDLPSFLNQFNEQMENMSDTIPFNLSIYKL